MLCKNGTNSRNTVSEDMNSKTINSSQILFKFLNNGDMK